MVYSPLPAFDKVLAGYSIRANIFEKKQKAFQQSDREGLHNQRKSELTVKKLFNESKNAILSKL
jgi:hypothetical protein